MATVWIVDGAYVMKNAPGKFEYLKLKTELEKLNGEPFVESFYVNSTTSSPTETHDAFHSWIKLAPPKGPKMRVQLHKLKDMHIECPNCHQKFDRSVQKGVDVAIATLLIKLAVQKKYDRLILTSGDGDLESAVEYVKDDLGKEFWVAGFNGSVSPDLQSYADRVIWIEDFWTAIQK